jgi:ACR3 family arsenite efflux pump ArsB
VDAQYGVIVVLGKCHKKFFCGTYPRISFRNEWIQLADSFFVFILVPSDSGKLKGSTRVKRKKKSEKR